MKVRRLAVAALLSVLLVVAPASARVQPRVHVQVLGHANPGGGYAGDVYAFGRFAYLSSWHGAKCRAQGVRVYGIGNPRQLSHVATFADAASDPATAGAWTEKTIVKRVSTPSFKGALAVVSFQSCTGTGSFHGFGLYDVTNPARPRKLALVRTEPRGVHEIWLQAVGRHAYVYAAIPYAEERNLPGLRIYDVTDPANPSWISSWRPPVGRNTGIGDMKATFVHSVITNRSGTRAFVSDWDYGTVILDVRNPRKPRQLSRTRFRADEEGNAHSTAVTPDGKLMIETHEWELTRPTLYDISNPRKPRRLSVFNPPSRLISRARAAGASGLQTGVHDPKIVGHRVYFSWYALGVLVADISNPRRPRFLTQFLPTSAADPDVAFCPGGRCVAVWGVFPTRSYALASDMVGGLWSFRVR
ncbi:MAG: hypothetical protein M3R70_02895 [Actinomycetota bacterium]|nr:hypothetical protein [Actinomycetota bacterium]